MIILNFSHPLTESQLAKIKDLTRTDIDQVIEIPVQFDNQLAFKPQLEVLMQTLPLTASDFQTQEMLVNPPSLNFITAVLIAELHGRMGYFPALIRLRMVEGSLPPVFEVAEIMNLNQMREEARKKRFSNG